MKVRVDPSRLHGRLIAPPSKSYTHRAILLASLCEGKSKVISPLISRDTTATLNGCEALGAVITRNEDLLIEGRKTLKTPNDIIDVQNSGTTLRLLTSIAALTPDGYTVFTGDESVRQRPMQPLLDTLLALGVKCWSTRLNGCAPIIVKGGGIRGGSVKVSGEISSQFISSLLVATAFADNDTFLKVKGAVVSRPYIDATLKVIKHFGGEIVAENSGNFKIPPLQKFIANEFKVPGDFSSASYILAGGALTEAEVSVDGLDFSFPQGDAAFLDILKNMGMNLSVDISRGRVTIIGGNRLVGGEFNLINTPDLLPVTAILACKAESEVWIRGVKHARLKETDRISVLAEELPKLGVSVQQLDDGLRVEGAKRLKRCVLNAHGDHRMALAFSIVGLASAEGCFVDGFESIDVSYPRFLEDINSLGGRLEVIGN